MFADIGDLAKLVRMALGTLIIKEKLCLSDLDEKLLLSLNEEMCKKILGDTEDLFIWIKKKLL